MKLGDSPALLVLSGQGTGSGVAHFISPVSFEGEYPPRELLETWCSLTDPVIPKTQEEIVLMVARQSTSDGTPWTILSEYVQANLKRSRRAKHYAGVSLLVKTHTLPVEAVPLIHDILVSMLRATMDSGHFVESLEDWHPSRGLLKELRSLSVEPLMPGFDGLQPGVERARIIHGTQADSIVRESQIETDYRDFSAAFLIRRNGEPEKDSYYIRSPYDTSAWEEALSPPPPPPEPHGFSNTAAEEVSFAERDDDISHSRTEYAPSLAIISSDLKQLRSDVSYLSQRVRKLETPSNADPTGAKYSVLEKAMIFVLIALIVLIVFLFARYLVAANDPVPPADEVQVRPADPPPYPPQNDATSSEDGLNVDDLSRLARNGTGSDPAVPDLPKSTNTLVPARLSGH